MTSPTQEPTQSCLVRIRDGPGALITEGFTRALGALCQQPGAGVCVCVCVCVHIYAYMLSRTARDACQKSGEIQKCPPPNSQLPANVSHW